MDVIEYLLLNCLDRLDEDDIFYVIKHDRDRDITMFIISFLMTNLKFYKNK